MSETTNPNLRVYGRSNTDSLRAVFFVESSLLFDDKALDDIPAMIEQAFEVRRQRDALLAVGAAATAAIEALRFYGRERGIAADYPEADRAAADAAANFRAILSGITQDAAIAAAKGGG